MPTNEAGKLRHKFLVPVAGVGVSLLFLLMIDFGAAQVCKVYCDQIWERGHREKFRQKDPIVHHALQANVKAIDVWGGRSYPLFTNSLGYRDSMPRDVEKEHPGKRILFMGDSFTEGSGVTWEESFVGQVQNGLASAGVEVLNSAVSSYAPAVYFARARHLIVDGGYKINHVFVFIDQSDIENSADWYRVTDDYKVIEKNEVGGRRRVFNSGFNNWLKSNSLIVAFAYQARDYFSYQKKKRDVGDKYADDGQFIDTSLWRERVGKVSETSWCIDQGNPPEWGDRGVEYATKYMDALLALLQSQGISMTIATYPWPSNILAGEIDTQCATVWESWAKQNKVDILNFFGTFIDGDDPWQSITRNYIPYDVHWNQHGHSVVARKILDYIRDANIVE